MQVPPCGCHRTEPDIDLDLEERQDPPCATLESITDLSRDVLVIQLILSLRR